MRLCCTKETLSNVEGFPLKLFDHSLFFLLCRCLARESNRDRDTRRESILFCGHLDSGKGPYHQWGDKLHG